MYNIIREYFLLLGIACLVTGAFAAELKAQQPSNAYFCPQADSLIKQDSFWTTKDQQWKNYTPSSASKVTSFLGAQWAGIKIGKIICLYQTNEAVAFPLAVEKVKGQPVSEPSGGGWSALTSNRRFCKSTSIADCVFMLELPKNIDNIYEEIAYNPKKNS